MVGRFWIPFVDAVHTFTCFRWSRFNWGLPHYLEVHAKQVTIKISLCIWLKTLKWIFDLWKSFSTWFNWSRWCHVERKPIQLNSSLLHFKRLSHSGWCCFTISISALVCLSQTDCVICFCHHSSAVAFIQHHFSFQQDQNIIITKFVWCILKYLPSSFFSTHFAFFFFPALSSSLLMFSSFFA